MSDEISGGYYLKARCIKGSKIAHAPPHAREVFDYFLRKAFWKDGIDLKRGQWLTSYKAIQEDLRWYVGNRPERYKKHQIETAVKLLTKAGAITTTKTTRGMIVTVCNYDFYQTQENYENHSEPNLKPTREPRESPTIDETGETLSSKCSLTGEQVAAIQKRCGSYADDVMRVIQLRPEFRCLFGCAEHAAKLLADHKNNPDAQQNLEDFLLNMQADDKPPSTPTAIIRKLNNYLTNERKIKHENNQVTTKRRNIKRPTSKADSVGRASGGGLPEL